MDVRQIIGQTFTRQVTLTRNAIDEKARTVELAFSSETESVERAFGVEILDHSKGSVRLARLNNGGAVLFNHDVDQHIGTIEAARIDQKDRKGRALLRFGRSARAQEKFDDIKDNILQHASVGYVIHKIQQERSEDGKPDRYRVVDWEPLEISMVPVPADATVGVGRQYANTTKGHNMRRDEPQILTAQEQREEDQLLGNDSQWDAGQKERHRTSQILELAKNFPYDKQWARSLGESAIQRGTSVNQFRKALLESIQDRAPQALNLAHDIGLDTRDLQGYSLMRLIQSVMLGQPQRAGLEMEVSQALQTKYGRQPQGLLVPWQKLMEKRLIEKGTSQSGVGLTGTQHMGHLFVDVLRAHSLVVKLGARMLHDLSGDLSVPKKTSASVASWVAEDTAASESTPTFASIPLVPKSVTSWGAFTRKMLLQSSPSVEQLLMDDLSAGLGTGIDKAIIAGSGQGAEPLGILGQQGLEIVPLGEQGAAPTWAKIVALESAVSVGNADIGSLAYLTNAAVRGKLKTTEKFADTNGQAIWPDLPMVDNLGTLNGYKAGVSNNVPSDLTKGTTGTALSAILFGNFADIMIGQWGGVYDMVIDPFTESKKGNTIITVYSDVDMALRNVQSFAAIVDAVTTP